MLKMCGKIYQSFITSKHIYYCLLNSFLLQIQSEEKCRALQERLELTEQKLAQFSRKAEAAAGEALAQVYRLLLFLLYQYFLIDSIRR